MAENFQVPSRAASVTKSDTTEIIGSAFRVGTTAGDVAIVDEAGNSTTIPNVQVGERIDVRFTKILATGTTAVGITRFW